MLGEMSASSFDGEVKVISVSSLGGFLVTVGTQLGSRGEVASHS